jgi:hypothetical protein
MNKPVIVLLILIFLALVANLVFVAVTNKSFIDDKMVPWGLFGILIVANSCVAGAGFYFVNKAHQKYEKSSLLWARRAFLVTFGVNALLAVAPRFFMPTGDVTITREEALLDVSIVLLLVGVPTALFAMAFYRDYRRVLGARPKGSSVVHRSASGQDR